MLHIPCTFLGYCTHGVTSLFVAPLLYLLMSLILRRRVRLLHFIEAAVAGLLEGFAVTFLLCLIEKVHVREARVMPVPTRSGVVWRILLSAAVGTCAGLLGGYLRIEFSWLLGACVTGITSALVQPQEPTQMIPA